MKSIHGNNPDVAPEEMMSADIDGNDLVIRLPLDLLVWSQRMREESLHVIDKVEMGKWLVENILEYGGDPEIGSTAIEGFLDAAFIEALESAEAWLQGWWELEEDSDNDRERDEGELDCSDGRCPCGCDDLDQPSHRCVYAGTKYSGQTDEE